jgi:hypothetical protein
MKTFILACKIKVFNTMKRKYWFVALTISLLLFWGSTCRKKQDACPLNPENYELHHVSEKGFRHIFQIDITDGECSGCHHVVAEKCGLVSIKKKNTGKYGVFKATIETKDKTLPSCKKESTFFPKKWTVQTTLDKIEDAYQKSTVVDGNEREGKTSEGVIIKIIMDKNDKGKIFNAYPIMQ